MKSLKSKGAAKYSKEASKPVEERKVGNRKAMTMADKSGKQKKKQRDAKEDPNKPKRPTSAFFVFLEEEFRKDFKKQHPDVKAVSAVGKAGGQQWKSMSEAEKDQFEAKAAKRKSEYEKLMKAYNKKQESTTDDADVELDRSKSEVNEEEDETSAEQEEEEEEDKDEDDD